MKPNITMIGMPSSGKSTVGVLLAKRLGFSFVDVDIVIQEKEGRLLKEIIAEEGMDGFLEVENRMQCGAGCTAFRDRSGRQRDLRGRGHEASEGDQRGGLPKDEL